MPMEELIFGNKLDDIKTQSMYAFRYLQRSHNSELKFFLVYG